MKKLVQLEFNFLPWDDEEIWKDIKGFDGKYQVNNSCYVRSWINSRGNRRKEPKILKPHKDTKGYYQYFLYKEGKRSAYSAHRLGYEAFIGEIPNGMQVNHKDENKQNNVLSNIDTLMTCKENINYGTHNERVGKANRLVQKNNKKKSKPVVQKTLQGDIIAIWPSTKEVERQLGYNCTVISLCCRGGYFDNSIGKWHSSKTAYGYRWEYEKATA